jgi:hypothetical protein
MRLSLLNNLFGSPGMCRLAHRDFLLLALSILSSLALETLLFLEQLSRLGLSLRFAVNSCFIPLSALCQSLRVIRRSFETFKFTLVGFRSTLHAPVKVISIRIFHLFFAHICVVQGLTKLHARSTDDR